MARKYLITVLVVVYISAGFLLKFHVEAAETHRDHVHGAHGEHAHVAKAPEMIVDLEIQPPDIRAGTTARILFAIKDAEGRPASDLTVTHERLLHVIVVGEDFSVFAHIHPEDFGPITQEMKKTAVFPVLYTFPKAGRYLVAVDSAVKDIHFSEHFSVDVSGEPGMGPLKSDLSRKKRFGDYEATLTSSPERITAGKETVLHYMIRKGDKPVTDLEPYLAAYMHLAIIHADLSNFIHAHGELPGTSEGGHPPVGHIHGAVKDKFGPEIQARVVFPVRGVYQIFSEIRHGRNIIPLSFMVEVE